MICRIENIKDSCAIILSAIDSNRLVQISEMLELETKDGFLYMSITNKESFVRVRVCECDDDFHATVNSSLFLPLVTKTSTETIELNVSDSYLEVKANGNYKIPLVYEGNEILSLPVIQLKNITSTFDIKSDILLSLSKYNSRQISIGVSNTLIQKLYYVDENGCITFTSGACINEFNLDKPVKLLFNDKLVKLLRLFKEEQTVKFSLAQDALSDSIIQTKVQFETDTIIVTAILFCDEKLISSVPVTAIRGMADDNYNYLVSLDRIELLDVVDRLSIFAGEKDTSRIAEVSFTKDKVEFEFEHNCESIFYSNDNCTIAEEAYKTMVSLIDLQKVLSTLSTKFVNIQLGNQKCFVIMIPGVKYIIPECRID